jgi:hypothetical protein
LGEASSEARDDSDVDDEEAVGESKGEWWADVDVDVDEASRAESVVAERLAAGRGRNVLDGIFSGLTGAKALRSWSRLRSEMRGGQEDEWTGSTTMKYIRQARGERQGTGRAKD